MDNFIVSARKYRPLTFDTVVGQGSITNTLKNAIKSNHLAHAYLFCGPRGIGKTTCARIFAKTINCTDLSENTEACGKCEPCLSFTENRSYNIHELDAASNNSVDDIRNLTDQVRIPPQVGKYSVYIIDEVHMLSQQAFNAFLKTLEEPPVHAIFILATTEKHKIIPTILSRCQIYDFNRMKVDGMVEYMEDIAKKEKISYEPEALGLIAQKADGAMRDALSIFDQIVSFSGNNITYQIVIENLNILDYEYYFRIVDTFLNTDISQAFLIFDEILDNGFDAHNFINGLSKHLRDLLVIKDPGIINLIEVGPAIKEKYKKQTADCFADFLFSALEIVNECDLNYKISKDKRLHIELCLVKLCNIVSGQKKKTDKLETEKVVSDNDDEDKLSYSENKNTPVMSESVDDEKKDAEIGIKKVPVKTYKKSTPSIKEALSGIVNKSGSTEDLVFNEADTVKEEQDEQNQEFFDLGQLIEKWNTFADQIRSEKRMHIALKNRQPIIKDNYHIEVQMDNIDQIDEFNKEIKIDLRSYLRKELRNNKLEVYAVITNVETSTSKAYTDHDKFEFMSKKNPALKKLKNELNLEFE